MRTGFTVVCLLLTSGVFACQAGELPQFSRKSKPANSLAVAILREASEIALAQDSDQYVLTRTTLLYIGEAQTRAGDFDGALRSFRPIRYDLGLSRGLEQLGEALARDGQRERAFSVIWLLGRDRYFEDYIDLRWIDRLIASGDFPRAGKAIEKLEYAEYRLQASRKLAVAYAKSGDADRAEEQFSRALLAAADLRREADRAAAMTEIANAQKSVGQILGARAANDVDNAKRPFRSASATLQPLDESDKVGALIAKGDLQAALTTAESIRNPSAKATAILQVATAHVHAGDRRAATKVAGRIELGPSFVVVLGETSDERFDYRRPRTWGVLYDESPAFTMAASFIWRERAAKLAAAAMEFSQVIGLQPAQPNSILFNQNEENVTQALARAHAFWGDANDALSWAKQTGSSATVKKADEFGRNWAVQRRIHALLGVAEGILDRLEDTHGRMHLATRKLQNGELESCWTDLAGDNSARARVAIQTLIAAPEDTVPCLRDRLKPVPLADQDKIQRRIRDLDSDNFAVRQVATKELPKLGEQVQVPIRKALAGKVTLESRRRLEAILRDLPEDSGPGTMRTVRATMILEKIGSPEAQSVLESLAGGAPGARVTEAARDALQRLRRGF
jgi:hypothetical protein